MADIETKATETTTVETSTPTIEELQAQLAEMQADRDKYKSANDKLSKSEAEMKRQLRAKQTEEEQKAEADAEAQRLRDEELENLRAENNRHKALSAYKSIDEKTVDKLIEAVGNNDHLAIAKIFESEVANAVKKAESQWLANRPRVNAGVGDGNAVTKQSIMAIADRAERQRAIAENLELFE